MKYAVAILVSLLVFNLFGQVPDPFSNTCNLQKVFLFETPECNNDNYTLTFEENFDSAWLNTDNWEIPGWWTGRLSGVDNAQEYNTFNNILLSNGTCKIFAKKESIVARAVPYEPDDTILKDGLQNLRQYNYTSSALFSKRKFLYGKYEIRCRLPYGEGFWPAFWAYTGPRWNELDIFDNKNHGAGQYECGPAYDFDLDGSGDGCRWHSISLFTDLTDWHTYTCYFEPHRIVWQIDGSTIRILYRYWNLLGQIIGCSEDVADGVYLEEISFPREKMNLIVNLAIREGNNAPADELLPASYEIDYVRFWEKNNEPCTGCIDDVTYENISQLPSSTRATNYISAGNDTKVLSGQEVKFKSPDIHLLPGFSVEQGGNFSAIPQECNIFTYEDVLISYIGNNAINGYEIDKCTNPIYSIDVAGALYYSFQVKNLFGLYVHSSSGPITTNHLDVWNTEYFGNGAYSTTLVLFNCSDVKVEQKTMVLSSPNCRLMAPSDSNNNETVSRKLTPELDTAIFEKEFMVYPNPAKDEINIFYTMHQIMPVVLIITDASGKELLKRGYDCNLGANKITLNVNQYADGTYFVKFVSGNESIESKFIISK